MEKLRKLLQKASEEEIRGLSEILESDFPIYPVLLQSLLDQLAGLAQVYTQYGS